MKSYPSIKKGRSALGESFYHFDYSKDFYELTSDEIYLVDWFRKLCGFSGKNDLGRSPARQFWYYLQEGSSNLPF